MSLKVFHFKGGRKGYSTGGVKIRLNKEMPEKIEELEIDKTRVDEFFKTSDMDVEMKKGKIEFKKKRKSK